MLKRPATEGVVELDELDRVLAEVVRAAEEERVAFTVVLARPGAASDVLYAPADAEVEDLAAALSVSLAPDQELFRAGHSHLAVLVPGRPGACARRGTRLANRASAEGAPLFSWAAVSYPRDATTPAGLKEVAFERLDGAATRGAVPTLAATSYGQPGSATAAEGEERPGGRRAAAMWAAAMAAVVFCGVAFAMHGSSAPHPVTLSLPGSGATPSQAGSPQGAGGTPAGSTAGGATSQPGAGSAPTVSGPGYVGGSAGGSQPSGTTGSPDQSTQQTGTDPTPTTVPVTTVPILGTPVPTTLPPLNLPTTTVPLNLGSLPDSSSANACAGVIVGLVCQLGNQTGGAFGALG